MTVTTPVHVAEAELWFEQTGEGPDVLLIAGLGDPLEAWQLQLAGLADRYRLTAFDNRGTGRTPLPDTPLTVTAMVEDAAALLRALEIPAAHVAGFSGGSLTAQELALVHPELAPSSSILSRTPRAQVAAKARRSRSRPTASSPAGSRTCGRGPACCSMAHTAPIGRVDSPEGSC